MTLRESTLSGDELSAWREYGYVSLGKVAPITMIQALCKRIDEIMLGKVTYPNMLMQLCPSTVDDPEKTRQTKTFKGSTLKYRKIQDLEQDPLFLSYIQHPLFQDITCKLIGNRVSAYRSMFMNKPADHGTLLNWHQDGTGSWGLSISPTVTIWTALDATSLINGCLQIIPASHKTMINTAHDQLYPEQIPIHAPKEKHLHLELEQGEVVLLHNWTLHRSEPNKTDRPRRAFSVCYIDSATVHRKSGERWPQVFPEYIPIKTPADN